MIAYKRGMCLTELLAQMAINTSWEEITPAAVEACKKVILDTIGVAIAGWSAPGIQGTVRQMQKWGGRNEATVLVCGSQVPAPNAACANGMMIHALDYDDVHDPASLHLMSVIFPAVLAAAEKVNASGQQILAGTILGVEAAARIGMIYNRRRDGCQGRGFMPTTVIGGFGAAAAACRLFGYSVDQTVHALGINYAQAGGNRQGLLEKTLTKRLQPGFAARSALWATSLAGRGLTGPEHVFEGEAGLFSIYIGAKPPEPEEITRKRDFFEMERVSIKRFSCCGVAHPVMQAAIDLAQEHNLTRESLKDVCIYFFEGGKGGPYGENLVGGPFEMGSDPQVNAQFCAPYGVALGLLRRKAGLAEFTNERIRQDTEVAELARRVRILTEVENPPVTKRIHDDFREHTDMPSLLLVRTTDGRELRKVYTMRDLLDPKRMSTTDVIAKFQACAEFSGICRPRKCEEIVTAVRDLDRCRGAAEFMRCCVLQPS